MSHPIIPDPSPTYLDHDLYKGEDGDGCEYLLTRWADGDMTLATRPLGAPTWGPPVILKRETL